MASGALPRVAQYKMLPHGEFIEFARTKGGGTASSSKREGGPPVLLQPVLWYR